MNSMEFIVRTLQVLIKIWYYYDLIYGARSLDEKLKILEDMRHYDQYDTINLDSLIKEHEEVIRKLVENKS